jgi:hypothetical protein
MTGACNFDCVAPASYGIPPFEVGVDRSIFFRYYCFEIVSCVEYLQSYPWLDRHEIRRSLYAIHSESKTKATYAS